MSCPKNKTSKAQLINSIKFYLTEVLEKPRDEFEGMPACPFIKKERLKNKLMIDVFDNENESFLDKIELFVKSSYTDAVFAQILEKPLSTKNSKIYQRFLNDVLKDNFKRYKTIVINPNDTINIKGFCPRSHAPCLLIVVTDREKLNDAHNKMLNTKYFKHFDDEYLKHLHVKREELKL